jgi:hypothetical protein
MGVQLAPFVEVISSTLAFTDDRATYLPSPYATLSHEPAGAGYSVHVEPSGETATFALWPSAIHSPFA